MRFDGGWVRDRVTSEGGVVDQQGVRCERGVRDVSVRGDVVGGSAEAAEVVHLQELLDRCHLR